MNRGIYICDDNHSLVWIEKCGKESRNGGKKEFYVELVEKYILYENIYPFLWFYTSGVITFGGYLEFNWYFKDAIHATIIVLHILKHKLGKNVTRLVAKAVWKTKNDLSWGNLEK